MFTLIVVREDLLGKAKKETPLVLQYQTQSDAGSMKNTPPCFAWYMAGLNFQWVKDQGGVEEMQRRHKYMADKLYSYIDSNDSYKCFVEPEFRSFINIPFNFTKTNEDLVKVFLKESEAAGLGNLKGYKTMGGFRASCYNALPTEAIDRLVDFMKEFAAKHL